MTDEIELRQIYEDDLITFKDVVISQKDGEHYSLITCKIKINESPYFNYTNNFQNYGNQPNTGSNPVSRQQLEKAIDKFANEKQRVVCRLIDEKLDNLAHRK